MRWRYPPLNTYRTDGGDIICMDSISWLYTGYTLLGDLQVIHTQKTYYATSSTTPHCWSICLLVIYRLYIIEK